MATAALFPSMLGVEFDSLDPCLKRVHSGGSQTLLGTATVERGSSLAARALAVVTSLPPAVTNASIQVRIDATADQELWTRVFHLSHLMESTLREEEGLLIERLGPVALKFRVSVADGAMRWALAHVSVYGIPLPLSWFCIFATIDSRNGSYHFAVNSELRGVGPVVRYEGLLHAAA